jgi:hypothetical protein
VNNTNNSAHVFLLPEFEPRIEFVKRHIAPDTFERTGGTVLISSF